MDSALEILDCVWVVTIELAEVKPSQWNNICWLSRSPLSIDQDQFKVSNGLDEDEIES